MSIEEFISENSLPNEEWKDIDGYEGCYKVSSLGRILSFPSSRIVNNVTINNPAMIMKPTKLNTGYYQIMLRKIGKGKKFSIHRLVASAFIPNKNSLPQVDHIDGDKSNNAASNLRWCSAKTNMSNAITQERVEVGRDRVNFPYRKKTQQHKDGVLIREYESAYSAREYGYNPSSIIKCCLGRLKSYKGFVWAYAST